jgi:penicillin-binding protein 2
MTPLIKHQIDLAPEHWDVILDGMRRSVQDPSAYNRRANGNNKPAGDILGDINRFNVAGKTGTAEYDEKGLRRSHSWFVGFAPFDDPEIAVVALLEGTGDLGDGSGTLALPAVVDVMRAYYRQPVPDINGDLPPPAPPAAGR